MRKRLSTSVPIPIIPPPMSEWIIRARAAITTVAVLSILKIIVVLPSHGKVERGLAPRVATN